MKKNRSLEIIYSIGARFEGGGIGDIAGKAVEPIEKKRNLKKLLCVQSKSTWMDESKVTEFETLFYLGYPLKGLDMLLQAGIYPTWIDKTYDYLSSGKMEKCDIFHGWNTHCLKSLEKASNKGATTVVERASAHPKTQQKILNEEAEKYGVKRKPTRNLDRACKELRKCDYITVPSNFVRESFINKGFDEEKLIKIPFGVDIEKFNPERNQDLTFRAIFVGSVQLRKGIQYVLKAWNLLELEDAELLVCGDIREDAKPVVERYRENDSIKFLGHVDKVPYDKADIFVFPSMEDGWGMVVTEALASGLPTITSKNTGAEEIIEEGEEGYVISPRDVETLAEKIEFFYENPEEVRTMSRKARKKAEQYTWEKYQEELMENYSKIA